MHKKEAELKPTASLDRGIIADAKAEPEPMHPKPRMAVKLEARGHDVWCVGPSRLAISG